MKTEKGPISHEIQDVIDYLNNYKQPSNNQQLNRSIISIDQSKLIDSLLGNIKKEETPVLAESGWDDDNIDLMQFDE